MDQEMTVQDLMHDPLIAMLMQADGIRHEDLDQLLRGTAEAQVEHLQSQIRTARASEFYGNLEKTHSRAEIRIGG
ncbi:hypothetical protein [Rhizobium oryzicola]|uniref:Uncharacterized protein n=1 Tax=Rhizobium oryzicola TaxID=1232668 RepID=A0ABT8SY09_9HYPH|nr:hypothetical protein [Rhizobium oryzicola]MDO1582517.1 hypothetical protein [Rhizobium oryzicola]